VQSVPITTNIVIMNPARGEVHSIQHYVIKFVSATGQWFSPVSSINKTECHDKTKILLKVALNNINQTQTYEFCYIQIRRMKLMSCRMMVDLQCFISVYHNHQCTINFTLHSTAYIRVYI